MDEPTYRKKVSELFSKLLRVFDNVDPDLAEAELAQGVLTIAARGKKLILSPQPPVRQVWLAASALGRAVHFDWNEAEQRWVDDKNPQAELLKVTEELLEKTCGQRIEIKL